MEALLVVAIGSISLLCHKLVDGIGVDQVGVGGHGQLLLLDLQLLLLLHPHKLVLLLLGHNCRGGGCSHCNGVVNPDEIRREIHPLSKTNRIFISRRKRGCLLVQSHGRREAGVLALGDVLQ